MPSNLKNRRRNREPYFFPLIVAADPGSATKPNVFSWWFSPEQGRREDTAPVELRHIAACCRPLNQGERVLVVIERTNWRSIRTAVTRNAARGIEQQAKQLWPRKALVVFVDPLRWQADLGIAGGPEAAYVYCHKRLDPPYDPPNGDCAQARCILEWAQHQATAYQRGLPNDIDGSRP